MKLVIQNLNKKSVELVESPVPSVSRGHVLVKTIHSAVSAGTERSTINFAKKNILQKAMARPDQVKRLLDLYKRTGLSNTLEVIKTRLDEDIPLGYSSSGVIVELGPDVVGLKKGDYVACGGAGYAVHGEYASIPINLVNKIPDNVDLKWASFTTIGSVAVQGIRLSNLQFGETVLVIGLGLVGLLSVQILKAAGCVVIGFDTNIERCKLAESIGCHFTTNNPISIENFAETITSANGVDLALITASTSSNEPIELASRLVRDRGAITVVGNVGLNIDRTPFYEKEILFRVSRSYGPGRYDFTYEQEGHDYPIGYVRWTEKRNMESFLRLISENKLQIQQLITHEFDLSEANKAYDLIQGKVRESHLGVVLNYPDNQLSTSIKFRSPISIDKSSSTLKKENTKLKLGLIGGGGFTTKTLLPILKNQPNIKLIGICTNRGLSARKIAEKYNMQFSTTDMSDIITNPEVDMVAITTPHNLHSHQIISCIENGKDVFCEKPMCLNLDELKQIIKSSKNNHGSSINIGFNRRFSPMIAELKDFTNKVNEPIIINYRINAGFLPKTHWNQNMDIGGGRLIGEACHFIDLSCHLIEAYPTSVHTDVMDNAGRYNNDNFTITINFSDGSISSINYVANGHRLMSKERIEIFGGGYSAIMDDFKRLDLFLEKKTTRRSRFSQDKGYKSHWNILSQTVLNSAPTPITFSDHIITTLTTIKSQESALTGMPVKIDPDKYIND